MGLRTHLTLIAMILILVLAACGGDDGDDNDNTSDEAAPAEDEGQDEGGPNADVTFVRATQGQDGTWRFDVTVSHPDTGEEDYADGWDVVLPDGEVVKPNPDDAFTRVLLHPHVDEQPFTRSQGNLDIPASVTEVTVRAHDSVDGFGGQAVVVDLTQEQETEFFHVRQPFAQ